MVGIEEKDTNFDVKNNNNIAQKNFNPVYTERGDPYTTTINFMNPTHTPLNITLYSEVPTLNWTVDMCNPSFLDLANKTVITPLVIEPGENLSLNFTIIPWDDVYGVVNVKYFMDDHEEIYSDYGFSFVVNNNPPDKPTGEYDKTRKELVVSTIDPNGNKVKYGVSWNNDENVDQWTELVPNGTEVRIDCKGKKDTVGVIAEDEYGAQSDWISVKPKNKPFEFHFNLLNWLFEQFPNAFPILRQLLSL